MKAKKLIVITIAMASTAVAWFFWHIQKITGTPQSVTDTSKVYLASLAEADKVKVKWTSRSLLEHLGSVPSESTDVFDIFKLSETDAMRRHDPAVVKDLSLVVYGLLNATDNQNVPNEYAGLARLFPYDIVFAPLGVSRFPAVVLPCPEQLAAFRVEMLNRVDWEVSYVRFKPASDSKLHSSCIPGPLITSSYRNTLATAGFANVAHLSEGVFLGDLDPRLKTPLFGIGRGEIRKVTKSMRTSSVGVWMVQDQSGQTPERSMFIPLLDAHGMIRGSIVERTENRGLATALDFVIDPVLSNLFGIAPVWYRDPGVSNSNLSRRAVMARGIFVNERSIKHLNALTPIFIFSSDSPQSVPFSEDIQVVPAASLQPTSSKYPLSRLRMVLLSKKEECGVAEKIVRSLPPEAR